MRHVQHHIHQSTPFSVSSKSSPRPCVEHCEYTRAVENYVGVVPVPVGISDPLRVNGGAAQGEYRVPLATTEATLVASYSRGARCITASGGSSARVLDSGLTRAPAFVFDSLDGATAFADWARSRVNEFKQVAEYTSRHVSLISVAPLVDANIVYLELSFLTGEAAGQNMVTKATDALLQFVEVSSQHSPRRVYIEGNTSGDKKLGSRSLTHVRGRRVSADVEISECVLKAYLGASVQELVEYGRVAANGAVHHGAVGSTGHIANGLTALFIACGQDVACVAESAVGITRFETSDKGLYASITLTSLVVGTIGGGTALSVQRANLDRMRLSGSGSADALAEICATLCLAGELSIAAAIVTGNFARAHRVFSRRAKRQFHISSDGRQKDGADAI